jgi:hypothetical protein
MTASEPFTVRPWAHGHPGAIIGSIMNNGLIRR